jgi:hypothetical protein
VNRARRSLIVCAVVACALGIFSSAASAGTTYDFYANIVADSNGTTYRGNIAVNNINIGLNTRIVVVTAVGADYDVTTAAGADYLSANIPTLSAGDTVTVRQPAAAAPTETYLIPAPSINVVAGGNVLTGNIPAGLIGVVEGDHRCDVGSLSYTVPAGAFNVAYSKIIPGEQVSVTSFSPSGDETAVVRQAAGETPCISVDGGTVIGPILGGPAPVAPNSVEVSHLLDNIASSVRVVLRRGASILADNSADGDSVSKSFAQQPLPGDIVDVYRPKTAPNPTYSATIPQVSSVFDPAAELVAIDGPAAGLLLTNPCRAYNCSNDSTRSARPAAAGRTLLDFKTSQGYNLPLDLRPDDITNVDFFDPDFTFHYEFPSHPGDLVAPTQSFKLPGKLKVSALVKALKKGYKIKLKSNEAGTAQLSLGKLAKVTKSVTPGTTTLKLKFSKSGKKAIRKLAAKGRKAKPLSVTLTSLVTDSSGNASTVAKKTKIKP